MIDFGDNFSWADKQLHFETELSNASLLFTAGGFADFVKKDEALEERKGALEKLSELATEDRKKLVQELVTLIFPSIGRIRDQPHDRWLKARRVCHSAIFDRYFSYRLGDQDISQSDLDQFVILADTREFVLRFFEEQWRQPSIARMAYNPCRRSPTSVPLFTSGCSATTFQRFGSENPDAFRLEGLEAFTPVDTVKSKLASLDAQSLDKDEKYLIEAFNCELEDSNRRSTEATSPKGEDLTT